MKTTHTTDTTATRWLLEPAHSSVEFRVPNFWGLVRVKGHFDRLDGWLEIHSNGDRRLELIIDAASLNTGHRKRDEHLRSADFFDTERHPEIRFRSTTVSDAGTGRLRVHGELLAAGERVELTLEPSISHTEDHAEIDVSTSIDQRQLGMTWSPLGMTRTPAELIAHAQLRRAT